MTARCRKNLISKLFGKGYWCQRLLVSVLFFNRSGTVIRTKPPKETGPHVGTKVWLEDIHSLALRAWILGRLPDGEVVLSEKSRKRRLLAQHHHPERGPSFRRSRVGMPPARRGSASSDCVGFTKRTRSVPEGIPTQSVGTSLKHF
jgi:hypothetical protein